MDTNLVLKSLVTGAIVWRFACWYEQDPSKQNTHMALGAAAALAVYALRPYVPGVSEVSNMVVAPTQP